MIPTVNRTLVGFATAVLVGSACGPSRLVDMRDATLKIRTEVSLWLTLIGTGTPETGCPHLDSSYATVEGISMKRLTPGGPSTPSPFQPEPVVCMAPLFDAKDFREDGGVAEFVLADDSATFVTRLSRPRGVRTLEVSGALQRGARVTLAWPARGELLDPGATTSLTIVPLDGGAFTSPSRAELEVTATEVSFTVPATLTPGRHAFSVTTENLTLSECEGPSSCVLDEAAGAVRADVVP